MGSLEREQKRKKHKKKNIAIGIFIAVMLLYPLIRFVIMWGYVNIRSLYVSFTRYDLWSDSNIFVGLLQYKMVFKNFKYDEYTQRTLLTSILYFPVTCFISLPLSVIFSYFLFKKVPCATVYRVIFYLPSLMPIAVLTLSFKYAFGPSGFVDPILNALGFHNLPLWWGSSTVTPIMVYVYCVWAGLGYNIVLFSGAMSRVPQELLEYNKLEGVGFTCELFKIMIPLVWPTVVTTFVIGMTSVLTVYLQPYFLMDSASPAPFHTCTISLLIFNGYATPANGPYLSAFGLICTAIFVPFILLGRFILNQFFKEVSY